MLLNYQNCTFFFFFLFDCLLCFVLFVCLLLFRYHLLTDNIIRQPALDILSQLAISDEKQQLRVVNEYINVIQTTGGTSSHSVDV
jgi:hypothetical protein